MRKRFALLIGCLTTVAACSAGAQLPPQEDLPAFLSFTRLRMQRATTRTITAIIRTLIIMYDQTVSFVASL